MDGSRINFKDYSPVVPLHENDTHYVNSSLTTTIKEIPLNVPYFVAELMVAVLAVVGNTLTITVFVLERKLRRLTNYYIVSLAAADLLVGIFGIPFAILTSLGLPKPLWACLLMLSTLIVLCTISIFSLVAVSIDRYWAILHPLLYSRVMTTKIARRMIFVSWVGGVLIGLLPMTGWHQERQDDQCVFTRVMTYDFLVFLYFATIVGPGVLMAVFYAHIYSVVIKQLRQISSQEPSVEAKDQESPTIHEGTRKGRDALRPFKTTWSKLSHPVKSKACVEIPRDSSDPQVKDDPASVLHVLNQVTHANRREVKAAKNLSIIVLFFMICWFPLYTINCVQAFCDNCYVPLEILNFTIILSHANSAINPFLYAYHMQDFRNALKILIFHRVLGRPELCPEPLYTRGFNSPYHSTHFKVANTSPHLQTPAAQATPNSSTSTPAVEGGRSRTSTSSSYNRRHCSCSLGATVKRPASDEIKTSRFTVENDRPRAATITSHTQPSTVRGFHSAEKPVEPNETTKDVMVEHKSAVLPSISLTVKDVDSLFNSQELKSDDDVYVTEILPMAIVRSHSDSQRKLRKVSSGQQSGPRKHQEVVLGPTHKSKMPLRPTPIKSSCKSESIKSVFSLDVPNKAQLGTPSVSNVTMTPNFAIQLPFINHSSSSQIKDRRRTKSWWSFNKRHYSFHGIPDSSYSRPANK